MLLLFFSLLIIVRNSIFWGNFKPEISFCFFLYYNVSTRIQIVHGKLYKDPT